MEKTVSKLFFAFIVTALHNMTKGQEIPHVAIDQSNYEVYYGNELNINCKSTTNEKVIEVFWEKKTNGLTIRLDEGLAGTTGIRPDTPAITILYATEIDSGLYTCFVRNSAGIGKSQSANVTIHGGLPSVDIKNRTYTVEYGNPVTLDCIVNAFPEIYFISWQRNISGQVTTLNTGAVGTRGITSNDPSLILNTTSLSDSGIYICTATNIAGTKRSEAITLSISGGIPTVETQYSNQSVSYGNSVTLKCRIRSVPLATSVYWEKYANGITSVLHSGISGTSGITIDNPSLTITKATLTDNGVYVCFARNKVGLGHAKTIQLQVKGGIPQVQIGAASYSTSYGNTITISCHVSSEPEHTNIFWKRTVNGISSTIYHNAVGTAGMLLSNPSLTLQFPTFSDSGTYTCHATNAVGTGQSQPTDLTVTGGLPVVEIPHSSYDVKYGESVTLTCNVTSLPRQTMVFWQKNSSGMITEIYEGVDGIQGATPSDPSLTIYFARPSDTGIYTCFATNAIGTAKSTVSTKLTVIADRPTVSIEKQSYKVSKGASIEIPCNIISNPIHTFVYWERQVNETVVTFIPGVVGFQGMTLNNPSLLIEFATETMSGNYSCYAVNEIGRGKSSAASLLVVPNPSDIPDSKTTLTVDREQTTTMTETEHISSTKSNLFTTEAQGISQTVFTTMTFTDNEFNDTEHQNIFKYNSTESHSSGGKTAGIVIGVLTGLFVTTFIAWKYWKRRQKRKAEERERQRRKEEWELQRIKEERERLRREAEERERQRKEAEERERQRKEERRRFEEERRRLEEIERQEERRRREEVIEIKLQRLKEVLEIERQRPEGECTVL